MTSVWRIAGLLLGVALLFGCSEKDPAEAKAPALAQPAGGEISESPVQTRGGTGTGAAGAAAGGTAAGSTTEAGATSGGAASGGTTAGGTAADNGTPRPESPTGGAAGAGAGLPPIAATGGASAGSTGAPTMVAVGGTGGVAEPSPVAMAGAGAVAGGGRPASLANPKEAVVVLFMIDGLQRDSAATAAANGATNLKMIIEQGVTVEDAYSVTPAPHLQLPDGSKPWGSTTAPNVAIHTGSHLYESRKMDDIFLAGQDVGIKSVYVGGANNYSAFTTPDFHYASGGYSDKEIVDRAIQHFKDDGVRLIRVHLQRIRDAWKGPQGKTDKDSGYVKAIVNADRQMGALIDTLKAAGVWDKTTLIVSSDHGMGQSSKSDHPASIRSSWEIFMGFYGPGIKQGQTIPYAESPDMAIMTAHLLGLRPLKGHTDPAVSISPKGATGTLLKNIFEGAPAPLVHPQPILKYLESENFKPPTAFVSYREGMLKQLQ